MRNEQYLFTNIVHLCKVNFFTCNIHVNVFSLYLILILYQFLIFLNQYHAMCPSYEVCKIHSYKDELVEFQCLVGNLLCTKDLSITGNTSKSEF